MRGTGLFFRAALAMAMGGCASTEAGITGDAGAASCGSCHTSEYAAWSTSRLAASGTSPVFLALSHQAGTAWGEQARARCVTCHEPGFGGDHGIGCVACHSATGNLADRDGLLTVDLDVPVSGPFSDPLSTPAHGSRTYGLLESPQLCGTCHEITGPALFVETTLDEYETSPAGQDGAGCRSCHMPEVAPGPIAMGETNSRPRADHSFVGFDPPWGAASDVAKSNADSTLQLLKLGLSLMATLTPDNQTIDVTLSSHAGHSIPTGVTFLRRIWVDVDFTGADGQSTTVGSVLDLGSQPTLDGKPVALITQADEVVPHVLASGATTSATVPVPSSLLAPVTAVVTLRGQAVRPEILQALGIENQADQVPTHQIAVVHLP